MTALSPLKRSGARTGSLTTPVGFVGFVSAASAHLWPLDHRVILKMTQQIIYS